MASETDLHRARQGARQALESLDSLSSAGAGCGSPQLRSLFSDISHRKASHHARLMSWLGQHSVAFSSATPVESEAEESLASPAPETPPSNDGTNADSSGEEGLPVVERQDVTADLITFKIPRPANFTFEPGQAVKVGLNGLRRSYSIVSAPHEPVLEFFVELVPGGQMSEHLRHLTLDQRLSLGTPKGSFVLDRNVRNHLMIATVTGINPFISMLRDQLQKGGTGHHFHLLHGASYQNEFGYREELEQIAAAHPELLTYIPTVSRPDEAANAGWQGVKGRVDGLVQEYLEQAGLNSQSIMVYACGNPGMIDAITQSLGPKGFRIKTEGYD